MHSASGEAATTSALGFINKGCGHVFAVELADEWFQQEAEQDVLSVRCQFGCSFFCETAQGETGIRISPQAVCKV